ncbi:complexin-like [Clytia hemisphaerica]|uniref:Complexin n=1 Tax=Clytia hemisphaerica TaxID=252671 RepID=A0A7M5WLR8_9CNID|eukprot:TCONS_00025833-protein
MDKVTQAMVAHKASALKSDMKSFGGGLIGDENPEDEQREKAETKRRHNSLKDMEERRERQRAERQEVHRKREEDREKVRSDIRNKYKLKGSQSYDGSYGNNKGSNEHQLSQQTEEICQQEEKSCSIQ